MQTLAKVQRELRREEAVECVGPPRPTRTGRIPFREQDVLRLEVEQVMRIFALIGACGCFKSL